MALAAGFASCTDDSADNPIFGPNEVYIYDSKAATTTATVGVEYQMDMIISPADGSAECRWVLDGVVISNDQNLRHTFANAGGPFELRFEVQRGTRVIAKVFQLTIN